MVQRPMTTILLTDYMLSVQRSDQLDDCLAPVKMGLYGEVGSILSVAKKRHRDQAAYVAYHRVLEEEFGDALWYFAALCRRLGSRLDEVFSTAATSVNFGAWTAASDLATGAVAEVGVLKSVPSLDDSLLELGGAAAELLQADATQDTSTALRTFAAKYLQGLRAADLTFAEVVRRNIEKSRGRFVVADRTTLPVFDKDFPKDEQLPWEFEIRITRRKSGRTYMQWNDVFIGDPLTDNIRNEDGYRFHDVFHIAHAAVLHWSPVFRALIKHKRKSEPDVDEQQDAGRAIVVEEGLTSWIFSRAKEVDMFEGHSGLSFDLLKTVQQFVAGYEVEECPLKLWEEAVLRGYEVFRSVRANEGGIVLGDRGARTIDYKSV